MHSSQLRARASSFVKREHREQLIRGPKRFHSTGQHFASGRVPLNRLLKRHTHTQTQRNTDKVCGLKKKRRGTAEPNAEKQADF